MKTKDSKINSSIDVLKWIVGLLIVAGGVAANYYYIAQPAPIRLIGWIVLVMVVAGIFATTEQGQRFLHFAKESKVELQKVVWPSRHETVQSTAIVAVMVVAVSFMLWLMDMGIFWAVGRVTSI
ncbi:MAG: preprotein translocase subunit SecE [Legionellales bacterium]|nr:preprotein translocase subunit SecE [Legionellales bacterium]